MGGAPGGPAHQMAQWRNRPGDGHLGFGQPAHLCGLHIRGAVARRLRAVGREASYPTSGPEPLAVLCWRLTAPCRTWPGLYVKPRASIPVASASSRPFDLVTLGRYLSFLYL